MDAQEQRLETYRVEYEQCMESYRHTYETIWQAGAVFAAISAGIVAFGGGDDGDLDPVIQLLAPLPFLFWYLGVFRPMNRYGERRSDRLKAIEETLHQLVGADLRHFREYDAERKSEPRVHRLVTLKWIWRPRVSEVVSILGVSLLVVEAWLFAVHVL